MITTTDTPAKNLRVSRCHGYYAFPGSDSIGCPVCGQSMATTTRQQRQQPWQVLDREEAREASRLPGGIPATITYERWSIEQMQARITQAEAGLADGSWELASNGTAWQLRDPYDWEIAKGIISRQHSSGFNLPGLRETIAKHEAKIERLERKLAKLGGAR